MEFEELKRVRTLPRGDVHFTPHCIYMYMYIYVNML